LIQRIDLRETDLRGDVIVKGQPDLQSMDWVPDGNGWFVSSRWAQGADLLYVEPNGSHTTNAASAPSGSKSGHCHTRTGTVLRSRVEARLGLRG